jgi:hypothetical protein
MIESPLMDRLRAIMARQTTHENIISFLESRFGSVPDDLADRLRATEDDARLKDILRFAATCPDLEAFRVRLISA